MRQTVFSAIIIALLVIHVLPARSIAEDKQKEFTNSIEMGFAFIPPGTFMMGSPSDEYQRAENEKQHQTTLTKGFYLQKTEVTQKQWKKVMGDNPSRFYRCGEDCPVDFVSWYDVQLFIKRLNKMERTDKYRLPTEAEWEYACRAGTETPFYFGQYLSTDQANYNGNHPIPGSPRGRNRNTSIPVGSFPPNSFGLYDMHGNVYEWCYDWYGNYGSKSAIDPKGASSGLSRVCRGGGLSSYARRCRSANRTKHLPGYVNFYIGFRLAKSLEDN